MGGRISRVQANPSHPRLSDIDPSGRLALLPGI